MGNRSYTCADMVSMITSRNINIEHINVRKKPIGNHCKVCNYITLALGINVVSCVLFDLEHTISEL